MFLRKLDGELLSFIAAGEDFKDQETGSSWNLLGEATGGPLAGKRLVRIVSGEHFWFAWIVCKPETIIWSPG